MPSAEIVFGGVVGHGEDGLSTSAPASASALASTSASASASTAAAPTPPPLPASVLAPSSAAPSSLSSSPSSPVEIRFSPPVALCGAALLLRPGPLWTQILRCAASSSAIADDDLALMQQETQPPPLPGPPGSSVDIFVLDTVHGTAAFTFTRAATCVLPSPDKSGAEGAASVLPFEWIASEDAITVSSVVICGLHGSAAIVLLGNPETALSNLPLEEHTQQVLSKQQEGEAETIERQGGEEFDPLAELETTSWGDSDVLLSHRFEGTRTTYAMRDLLSDNQQKQLQSAANLFHEKNDLEEAMQHIIPILGAIWHRLDDPIGSPSQEALAADRHDEGSYTTIVSVEEWKYLSELAVSAISGSELEDNVLHYVLLLSMMGLRIVESRDIFALVFGHADIADKLVDLVAPQNAKDICSSETDAQLCSEDNPIKHPGISLLAARTLSWLASSPYAYGSFLKVTCVDRVATALAWSAKANPVVSRALARALYYFSVSSAVKAVADVHAEFTGNEAAEDKSDIFAKMAHSINFLASVLSNEDLPQDFSWPRESEWNRWVLDLNLTQGITSPHKSPTSQRHARVCQILRCSRVFTQVSLFAVHALKHDILKASSSSPSKWSALRVLESVALLWDVMTKNSVVGILIMTSDGTACKSFFAAYCHWNWRIQRVGLLAKKAVTPQAAEILMSVCCAKLVASTSEESALDTIRTIKKLSGYSDALAILVFPPCLEKLLKLMLLSSTNGLKRLKESEEEADSTHDKELVILGLHVLSSAVGTPTGVAGLIDQWSATDASAIFSKCHEFLIFGSDNLHDEGYAWVELIASIVGVADTAMCLAGADGLTQFARRLENDVDAVAAEGVGLRRRWQTAALISTVSKLRCLSVALQTGSLTCQRSLIGRLSGPLFYCERLFKLAAASASLPGSLPLNEAVLAAESAARAVSAILHPFSSWAGDPQLSDDRRGWRRQTLEVAIAQLHERIVRESMEANVRSPAKISAIDTSVQCLGKAIQALSAAAAPDYYCWEGPLGALASDPLESTTTLMSRATLLTDAIDALYSSKDDSSEGLNDIRNWIAFGITTEGGVLELVEHLAWSSSKMLRRKGIALAVRLASASSAAPEALLPTLYQLCEKEDSLMSSSSSSSAIVVPLEKDKQDDTQITSTNFDEAETDQSRVARLLVFLHSLLTFGPVRAAMAATNLPAYISTILDFFPPDSPHLLWIARVICRFLDPGPRSSSIGAADVAVSCLPNAIATDGFIMLLSLFDSSSAPAILATLHATGEYVAKAGRNVVSELLSQPSERLELPSLNGRLGYLAERLEASPKERTLSTEAALISKQLVGIASKNNTGAALVNAIVSAQALEKLSGLLMHRPTEKESVEEAIQTSTILQALKRVPDKGDEGSSEIQESLPDDGKASVEWEFPKSSAELLHSFAVAEESARMDEALEEGVEDAALFEFGEWSLTGAGVDEEARPALALPTRGASNFRLRRNTPGRKASMHVDVYQGGGSGGGGGGGAPVGAFWMI